MNDNLDPSAKLRQNLLLAVAVVLLAGFLLSGLYMHFATARQANADTQALGQTLAKQSQLLLRPLLLSDDRVSLNYLINGLAELDYLAGMQVQEENGVVIARAGRLTDLKQQLHLKQQNKTIGTLTLWLDNTPMLTRLRNQLWPLAIIALTTLLLALAALWYSCRSLSMARQTDDDETESRPTLNFSDALATQATSSAATVSFAADITDSAWTPTPNTPAADMDTGTGKAPATAIPPQETVATPAAFTTDSFSGLQASEPAIATSTPPLSTTDQDSSTPFTSAPLSTEQHPADRTDHLHTSELVDLLRPELASTPQMPKFEHHPQGLDDEESDCDDTMVLEEQDMPSQRPAVKTTISANNPLFKADNARNEREEVQLDLYSFEHELELFLPPQDALYLFYIDSHTASSDNMPADEKATLLNVYHHLAKQVARIYNGEAEKLENNDILLRFELHDEQDSHGVNALCAAMLFTLLYKGFNQSRIRGFQPVLSLQMSLARGHNSKYNLVKEEAHFLTRTTQSNELISHTALTEAPLLKQAMLEAADIRREDEDKVLLLKVTPKHQALLQKQANHLLTKIFKK